MTASSSARRATQSSPCSHGSARGGGSSRRPARLAAEPWDADEPVRVRMGLHSGEGTLSGDSYVGIDVHRVARIANAGHGGQVLLSAATRMLAEAALPDGVTVRELGEFRLKDLSRPEQPGRCW